MFRLRSSNPVMRTASSYTAVSDRPLTYANVAAKTVFLVFLIAVSGILTYMYLESVGFGLLIGAMIIGFISVIVGTRSVRFAPYASVVYALAEGVVLGFISAIASFLYEGIVPTAILTTLIVLLVMMLLYSTGIIKVTHRFASVLVVGLIAVIIMALLSLILPFSGPLYYLVCGISAVLAALFLLLDFESIKSSVDAGADQSVGWILALGLMVTMVWLYIERLRVLMNFATTRR